MSDIDFSKYSRLPSLPTVAIEAVKLFHDPNSSNEALIAVVRKDPAIVVRLLKAANSPKYGSRSEVTDLMRAVNMLGRATTASLVLSFSLARQSMESSEYVEYFRRFWLRSFVQATAAEVLACQFGSPAFRGECYTTNLLSGLGKLAILRAEPKEYVQILKTAAAKQAPLTRIEQELLGFTHCGLSSFLLKQMGLPERCHDAIRGITDSTVTDRADAIEKTPLVRVTRIADAAASLICDDTAAIAVFALREAIEQIDLPNGFSAEELIDQVKDRLEAATDMFDIDPPKMPSAGDVLQDALDQLSRYAMMANNETQSSEVPSELLEENGRLKRRVADLLEVSRIDALTGVCNRAYFMQRFHEQIALHRVRSQAVGIAVVDIDHFKKVNDTYGHQAGDTALKVIAETLKNAMRETDVVGRYGGEEFVVILEDANPDGLAIVGERIRTKIEESIVQFEGKRIPVTASVGLAEGPVQGSEEEFGKQLFALADAAMYRAKKSGRNCFMIETMPHIITGPQSLEPCKEVSNVG
jgi:diguanylate cyclase (GGDEF)-like protein